MIFFLLLHLLVKSIALEYLLYCTLSQQYFVLFYDVCHLIVLLRRLVANVVGVVLAVGPERRLESAFSQRLPGKVAQPCVVPKFVRTTPA